MGALQGLKILDFSTLLPGPYATMTLADLGAEVLKVSMKGRQDLALDFPPYLAEDPTLSANQAWLDRNKKTMFLNLKTEEGRQIVRQIIGQYDILLEQNRPGTMDRLGLGYEELSRVQPRLIYCSLSGYGQTGPKRLRAGHDINYLALSGNMGHAGRRDTGPVLTNIQIGDLASGAMNVVVAILAAAHYRSVTGQGQYLDIAMLDGLVPFNAMDGAGFLAGGAQPEREGCRLNGGCAYDFYETQDGGYISVGALEDKFWAAFCRAIGCEDLIEAGPWPEDVQAVKSRIRAVIRTKTRAQWTEIFRDTDACVEPVLSAGEALMQEQQLRARQMVVDVELPLQPGKRVPQIANPIKMSKTPPEYRHCGYPLGYHTDEIMRSLGYSDQQIAALREKQVF